MNSVSCYGAWIVAIRQWAEWLRNQSFILGWDKKFSFVRDVQINSGLIQPSVQWVSGLFLLGLSRGPLSRLRMCRTTVYLDRSLHLMVWCLMKCSGALLEVHSVASQNIVLFIVTTVIGSNLCVLVLQIMEEVDLNSSPASYKSPLVRPGSKSSALKSWS